MLYKRKVAHPCATYEKHNSSVLGWHIRVPHTVHTRRTRAFARRVACGYARHARPKGVPRDSASGRRAKKERQREGTHFLEGSAAPLTSEHVARILRANGTLPTAGRLVRACSAPPAAPFAVLRYLPAELALLFLPHYSTHNHC